MHEFLSYNSLSFIIPHLPTHRDSQGLPLRKVKMTQEQERTATATRGIWKNYSPPTLNAEGKLETTCQVVQWGLFRNNRTKCKKTISDNNLLEAALIHHCEYHDRKFFLKHKLGPQHEFILGVAVVVFFLIFNTTEQMIFRLVLALLLLLAAIVFFKLRFREFDRDAKIAIWHYYSAPKLNAEGLSEVTCNIQTGFFGNEKCKKKLRGDQNTVREKALLHYYKCHSNVQHKYQNRIVVVWNLLYIPASLLVFGDEQTQKVADKFKQFQAIITSICSLTSANNEICRNYKESQTNISNGTLLGGEKGLDFLQISRLDLLKFLLISLTALEVVGLYFLVKIIVHVIQFLLSPLFLLLKKLKNIGS